MTGRPMSTMKRMYDRHKTLQREADDEGQVPRYAQHTLELVHGIITPRERKALKRKNAFTQGNDLPKRRHVELDTIDVATRPQRMHHNPFGRKTIAPETNTVIEMHEPEGNESN